MNDKRFEPILYEKEHDLEEHVKQHSAQLFGQKCVYLPIRALVSSKLSNRVTDGLLLDISNTENPRFWIVELELATHSVRSHVEPQVRDFIRALEDEGTRSELVEVVYDQVKSNPVATGTLLDTAKGNDLHWMLTHILKGQCGVMIVADEPTDQLQLVCNDLTRYKGAAEVKLVIFRSFRNKENNTLFAFTSPREELETDSDIQAIPPRAATLDSWSKKLEWADKGGSNLVSALISNVEIELQGTAHKPIGRHYAFYANGLGKGRFMAVVLSKGHIELRFGIPKDSPVISDRKLKAIKEWFFHSPRLVERGMTVRTRADIQYASKFIRAAYDAARTQT